MNDKVSLLAMRELRKELGDFRAWTVLAAITSIVILVHPFNATGSENILIRALYWAIVVPTTYCIGYIFFTIGTGHLLKRRLTSWISAVVAGLCAGPFITVLAVGLSLILSQDDRPPFLALVAITASITAITVGIFIINWLWRGQWWKDLVCERLYGSKPATGTDLENTVFWCRLDTCLGRDLICIQSQDHYLQVTTASGQQTILLRMGDVENELGSCLGLRVHRSWWVSYQHIKSITRNKDRMTLVLSNNQTVPVGRKFAPAIRQRFTQLII